MVTGEINKESIKAGDALYRAFVAGWGQQIDSILSQVAGQLREGDTSPKSGGSAEPPDIGWENAAMALELVQRQVKDRQPVFFNKASEGIAAAMLSGWGPEREVWMAPAGDQQEVELSWDQVKTVMAQHGEATYLTADGLLFMGLKVKGCFISRDQTSRIGQEPRDAINVILMCEVAGNPVAALAANSIRAGCMQAMVPIALQVPVEVIGSPMGYTQVQAKRLGRLLLGYPGTHGQPSGPLPPAYMEALPGPVQAELHGEMPHWVVLEMLWMGKGKAIMELMKWIASVLHRQHNKSRVTFEDPELGTVWALDGLGRPSVLWGTKKLWKPVDSNRSYHELVANAPWLVKGATQALLVTDGRQAVFNAPHERVEVVEMLEELEQALPSKVVDIVKGRSDSDAVGREIMRLSEDGTVDASAVLKLLAQKLLDEALLGRDAYDKQVALDIMSSAEVMLGRQGIDSPQDRARLMAEVVIMYALAAQLSLDARSVSGYLVEAGVKDKVAARMLEAVCVHLRYVVSVMSALRCFSFGVLGLTGQTWRELSEPQRVRAILELAKALVSYEETARYPSLVANEGGVRWIPGELGQEEREAAKRRQDEMWEIACHIYDTIQSTLDGVLAHSFLEPRLTALIRGADGKVGFGEFYVPGVPGATEEGFVRRMLASPGTLMVGRVGEGKRKVVSASLRSDGEPMTEEEVECVRVLLIALDFVAEGFYHLSADRKTLIPMGLKRMN